MHKYFLWLFIGSALPSALADHPSSIDTLLAEALNNHPQIAALEAEIEAARAGRQQALIRSAPELSLEAGFKDTDAGNGYAAGAGLMFPLERSGKRNNRDALARQNITQAELALNEFKRDLEFQLKSLCLEHALAMSDAATEREITARCRQMIDHIRQRPATGPVSLLESKILEAGLLERQVSMHELNVRIETTRSEINILLGREPSAELNVHIDTNLPTIGKFNDAFFQSLESYPGRQVHRSMLALRELETASASLESRPDVEVGPFVARDDAGESETVIGVAFSMPLASRNRNRGAVTAARARQQRAAAELESEIRASSSDLARRIRLYEMEMELLNTMPSELVEDMRNAAELADRQYRLGAIPIQLFLDMQREYLAVQQRRNASILSVWHHALELQRMTGINMAVSP